MQERAGLGWAWFMNLVVPLMVLAFVYGCGGTATLRAPALHPESTALEGKSLASQLATRWNPQARLISVEGWRVKRDGRLSSQPDSLWVYTFRSLGDGAFYEVRQDGRGTVDAGPKEPLQTQSIWEEMLDGWAIDSPAVAAMALQSSLSIGEQLDMQLTQDGVWRLSADDGKFVQELQIDARSGKRLL